MKCSTSRGGARRELFSMMDQYIEGIFIFRIRNDVIFSVSPYFTQIH